jgi:OmpA-OmpF porin, OOP family
VPLDRPALAAALAFALGAYHAGGVAQVAAAPAVVAAPIYEKVVFDADVLFDAYQSNLLPAGRAALDAFLGRIRGLASRSVTAIGYAERMGSTPSSQVLSEERVGTVKAYLVANGIAGERITTSNWGERRPTSHAAECGNAGNAPGMACLHPERRVFIEISGSRLVQ